MNKRHFGIILITAIVLSSCNSGGSSGGLTLSNIMVACSPAVASLGYGDTFQVIATVPSPTTTTIDIGLAGYGTTISQSATSCQIVESTSCFITATNTNATGAMAGTYASATSPSGSYAIGTATTCPTLNFTPNNILTGVASPYSVAYGATSTITATVPNPTTATITFGPPTGNQFACPGTIATLSSSTCQLNNATSCSVVLTNTNVDSGCGGGSITVSTPNYVSYDIPVGLNSQ